MLTRLKQAHSKQTLKSLELSHTPKETNSKQSLPEGQRITRRMRKMLKDQVTQHVDKCVICLSNFPTEFATLDCDHSFCLDCIVSWWRTHSNCPCCRDQFQQLRTNTGRTLKFENIPRLPKRKDEDFIAHCELCWGQIDGSQTMRVCTVCRGVYWHQNCLSFQSRQWYCVECAEAEGLDD